MKGCSPQWTRVYWKGCRASPQGMLGGRARTPRRCWENWLELPPQVMLGGQGQSHPRACWEDRASAAFQGMLGRLTEATPQGMLRGDAGTAIPGHAGKRLEAPPVSQGICQSCSQEHAGDRRNTCPRAVTPAPT